MKNIRKIEKRKIKKPVIKADETLIVKIGSEDYPASNKDIEALQLAISQCINDPTLTIVSHHCIDFVVVKTKDLEKAKIIK